jgi:hypothetical protein
VKTSNVSNNQIFIDILFEVFFYSSVFVQVLKENRRCMCSKFSYVEPFLFLC